jgi:hypothetical protein
VQAHRNSSLIGRFVDPNDAIVVRDALWSEIGLLENFVRLNPAGLPQADLEIARTWRRKIQDTFMLTKHLKKHSIFISGSRDGKVYGVVGMSDPLEDTLLFETPCMVKTVLIPFEGKITYDSLLISYPISFGRNIKADLNRQYQDARKGGNVIETLDQSDLALVN